MPQRARRPATSALARGESRSHCSGTNNPQFTGQDAVSVARCALIPIWQLDLPGGAGVLAGHARRGRARFQVPGVVEDHRFRGQLAGHPLGQLGAHQRWIPRRVGYELLQGLLVAVGQACGHRLDRLAFTVHHQPAQLARAPPSPVLTSDRGEHVASEGLQLVTRRRPTCSVFT
jgi:hypothetical protein